MAFLLVNRCDNFPEQKADGIVGLAPASTDNGTLLVNALNESGIIDTPQFLIYIGKEGVDGSYIDFGKYEGDFTNFTVLEVNPYNSSGGYVYWNITHQGVFYNDSKIDLSTNHTVWSTGASQIGFPLNDLLTIINIIAGDRGFNYFADFGYFGYKCEGIENDNNKAIKFLFGNKSVTVNPHEFIQYTNGV